MQTIHCHGDWLIDYADGVLPPQQRAAAEEHLAACTTCQQELAALQTSGAQLHDYFAELRRTEQCSVLPNRSRWTTVARRAIAVAACLAVFALGYWLNRQADREVVPLDIVQRDPQETMPIAPPSHKDEADDIAAEIARETQIARLKAAITVLKDEPGMSERSAALREYLSQTYQVDYELPSM